MSEDNDDFDAEDDAIVDEEHNLDGNEFDDMFSSPEDELAPAKESLGDALPTISGTMSHAMKSVALRQALEAISNVESGAALSDADMDLLREFFCALYGGDHGYRHEYSSLSALMYKLLEENEAQETNLADNVPYKLETLAFNITMVRQHLERLFSEKSGTLVSESVLSSVRKLDDHVELEFERIKYQVKQNSTLRKSVDDLTSGFETSVGATERTLTQQLERNIKEAEKRSQCEMDGVIKRFKQDVRDVETKSQRNYVSVLGIFISLVISFSAGIRLSAEAVQALSGMGRYRFAAVLSIIVFGMIDLILTLLFFILVVTNLDGGAKRAIKYIGIVSNIAFAIAIISGSTQKPVDRG